MKTAVLLSALLAATANAQPRGNSHGHLHRREANLEKREVVVETEWVTEIAYVTALVGPSTTKILGATQAPEPEPVPEAEQPEPEVAAEAETTTSSPPPPPPTTTPTPEPTPEPEQPKEPEPPKEPEQPKEPETPDVKGAVLKELPQPPAGVANSNGAGGGGGNSKTLEGELTYYDPGLGACGMTHTKDDLIIAIAVGLMGSKSNGNPYCGKTATLHANGKTVDVTIVDKCMGCSRQGDADGTTAVWEALGIDTAKGRVGVELEIHNPPPPQV